MQATGAAPFSSHRGLCCSIASPAHTSRSHLCARHAAAAPCAALTARLRRPLAMHAAAAETAQDTSRAADIGWRGVHHVGFIIKDLERSKAFYEDVLGLPINEERPHDRLPFRGIFYWLGSDMLHLMELPNPDPMKRPQHGGRDRHVCVGIGSVDALEERLKTAGVDYTRSKSGRPAIFFRDPDQNTLECFEAQPWRSRSDAAIA